MDRIKKTYHTTEVQIASFHTPKGITEYHVLFQQTDCTEDFRTQLARLQAAYDAVLAELPGNPTALFKRYFLSDVTNQTDELMEQERLASYCAVSVVQQAPMNGTKIALWAWLQTGVQTQVLPNGMFEVHHNGYRQLLSANLCNRAANAEYQTRLIFRDYILQLTNADCTLAANCLRTWIFVQNVDVNYPGVVKARKEVFATQGLTEDTHFIASTGIEGRYFNPLVFVTMDAYAVFGIVPEQIRSSPHLRFRDGKHRQTGRNCLSGRRTPASRPHDGECFRPARRSRCDHGRRHAGDCLHSRHGRLCQREALSGNQLSGFALCDCPRPRLPHRLADRDGMRRRNGSRRRAFYQFVTPLKETKLALP